MDFLTAPFNKAFMPIIVQLYILTAFGYIVLSHSIKDIFSDNLLKKVLFLLVYAGSLRVVLGINPQLPYFFHASVFLAYALFAPGAYLYLRNFIYGRSLKEPDFIHILPFLTLCIYGLFTTLFDINIRPELRKIWSFTSNETYDSKLVMPLFLFIYCLTGFYFFRILLLLKRTVLKKEHFLKPFQVIEEPVNDSHSQKADLQPQPVIISHERMMEIDRIVKELLDEKKPYLQQRYLLKDLANDTNIPLHHLSAFINKYWGKNFNDFINEFRVHYCKEKILNEEYKYKKLEAIAEESGFNNRNTFAIAFKKVMGVNPSEFLRKLKSSNYEKRESYEMKDTRGYLQSV